MNPNQLWRKPEKNMKMKKNKSVEDQFNSTMDDVKSGYEDVEETTVKAVTKAKDDVVTWFEEGVSNIKEGSHQLMDDAKETYDKATKAIDKNVKNGLNQYEEKVQEIAEKVPGDFGDKVLKYPWVAISVGVLLGLVLGILLKPTRHDR